VRNMGHSQEKPSPVRRQGWPHSANRPERYPYPPAQSFKYDVFMCHSHKDKAVVSELAGRLRADGLRVWLDDWELRPGDMIPHKIHADIEQSRFLVLAMSADAYKSDWVSSE
jgi:hypothetical protein